MTKALKKLLFRIILASSLFILFLILDYLNIFNNIFYNTHYHIDYFGQSPTFKDNLIYHLDGHNHLHGDIFGNYSFSHFNYIKFILFFIPYIIIAYDVIFKALCNIKNGKIFDENFLMLIATVCAFLIGQSPEAVAVMLFYQVGECFQTYSVNKSRKSIKNLMNIMPEYANVEIEGDIIKKDPKEVLTGSTIVVKPGEKIPIDGIVIKGDSFVDTSSITGEVVPRKVKKDDNIVSGCINQNGILYIKTIKSYENSTVAKILSMVENIGAKKAGTEKFITKFARYYTPIVVVLALALFIIPTLITQRWDVWLGRACSFLVISCPCALVVSVPLGFFGGIGKAARLGILIKGGNYVEAVDKLDTVVFDKTGTLTYGVFEITKIIPNSTYNKDELLRYAAIAEHFSNHPIAVSIKNEYEKSAGKIDIDKIADYKEISGRGISVKYEEDTILVGNKKLLVENGIDFIESENDGTICFVVKNNKFVGSIIISDIIKKEAKEAVEKIKKLGLKNIVMLTGDVSDVGKKVAQNLGIKKVYTDLLPSDKVYKLEDIIKEKDEYKTIAFVGDGINDTPVLKRADVGIAMGAMGQDAAIEVADVVIMDDNIDKIATLIKLARSTMSIIKQNIALALVVKIAIIILSAFGLVNMWIAIFGDVGVSIICILNTMRLLYTKIKK